MRASDVPTCWPISARMTLTVTMPLPSIEYHCVGSNGVTLEASAVFVSHAVRKEKATPVPAAATRKPRRLKPRVLKIGVLTGVSMVSAFLHFGGSLADRGAHFSQRRLRGLWLRRDVVGDGGENGLCHWRAPRRR